MQIHDNNEPNIIKKRNSTSAIGLSARLYLNVRSLSSFRHVDSSQKLEFQVKLSFDV